MARGHADRIERVIGHAVQNALDATDPSGRVWVIVDRVGGRGRVVVGDTGHGMSSEFIRERLFKPFQTTKKSGMGIGAYESFQYVRSLGGDVRVESEEGVGTVITMLFPLFEGANGAPLSERVGDGE
jgi:signal transduction histidine kinase